MAQFRLETVWDSNTGVFKIEIYYPNDAKEPMAVSPSVFRTHEEALPRAVDLLKEGIPNQSISATEAGLKGPCG